MGDGDLRTDPRVFGAMGCCGHFSLTEEALRQGLVWFKAGEGRVPAALCGKKVFACDSVDLSP